MYALQYLVTKMDWDCASKFACGFEPYTLHARYPNMDFKQKQPMYTKEIVKEETNEKKEELVSEWMLLRNLENNRSVCLNREAGLSATRSSAYTLYTYQLRNQETQETISLTRPQSCSKYAYTPRQRAVWSPTLHEYTRFNGEHTFLLWPY